MKKEKIIIFTLISIVVVSITIFLVMSVTFSKYETSITGNVASNIAFYLTKADYQVQQIKLTTVKPREDPYVYTFSVSNVDGTKVSDVDISYILRIVTTTNLPLEYELYMNENYNSGTATNLVSSNNTLVGADEYGTYFKTITMPSETLLYSTPKTNNYTLLIYYDEDETDAKYQDTVESIKLIVGSQQIIE